MSNKKFLSASRIGTLDKCSWTYWCKYHLHLPDSTNAGALRGSVCHLVLELLLKPRHKKHFDSITQKQTIKASPAVDKTVIKFLKANGIHDEENYSLCDSMIYAALSHDFFGGEGAHIDKPEEEFRIENKDPEYNICGFIDKPIQYKKTKTVEIIDYKTSKQKFKGEELESNVQALMYSLAAKKLWPKMKKVIVRFLFLRFSRSPIQELEYTNEQLKGFEYYLEHVNKVIDNFDENSAKSNFATNNGNHWLCGPAKSGWICPFYNPFSYYVLLDDKKSVMKSSHKNEFVVKEGQIVEKREYKGCPQKNCSAIDHSKENVVDDFDF